MNCVTITNNNLIPMRKCMETKRKCSFCKQTSHKPISNCSKRITLSHICKGREYKDYNAKMMFIESMKRGPRSKLNCNQKWAPILNELFHKKKPNHILVHTSYAKEQDTLSQSNIVLMINAWWMVVSWNNIFLINFETRE